MSNNFGLGPRPKLLNYYINLKDKACKRTKHNTYEKLQNKKRKKIVYTYKNLNKTLTLLKLFSSLEINSVFGSKKCISRDLHVLITLVDVFYFKDYY